MCGKASGGKASCGKASCARSTPDDAAAATDARASRRVATDEYLPSVVADVLLPERTGVVPLVVMVPGGAWVAADRTGLGPLSDELAADGIAVVNATHRPAGSDVRFPVPVQDVVCSVDFAVARVRAAGLEPSPVVLLGHSSGAHLAALAVLATDRFRGECGYPPVAADALVGLAGTYDVAALVDVALPLFGVPPGDDPVIWREGNPLTWVGRRPSVPVFIGHGDADRLVPLSFSLTFADAIQHAGHPVHVEVVPGADHHSIFGPDVIAEALTTWFRSLDDNP